jgi:hypothetical protein
MSPPRLAACSHRRGARCAARPQAVGGGVPAPPVWHDGTERPIQRPKDPEDQQEYYSGKKKGHTLKNLLVIRETCHICFLSPTYEGRMHDKTIAELEGYRLPPGSGLYQDMGFQGFFLAGVTLMQPQKKPRGGDSPHPRKPSILGFPRSESA